MKSVIHWKIPGFGQGYGKPIPTELARTTVRTMNRVYGQGTHWSQVVKPPPSAVKIVEELS